MPGEILDDDTVIVTEHGILIEEPEPFAGWPDALIDQVIQSELSADDPGGPVESEAAAFEYPSASEAFTLSSRPNANLTIYLDFTGHTTEDTYWNSSSSRPDSFYSAPYSRDSNPAFNTTELEYIGRIWEQVAEDYAPFNVNVTTEEPSFNDLWRSSSSDQRYGTRIVISPTQDWYGSSGGVAYVGSFDWVNVRTPDNQPVTVPAFVFSDALGGGHYKYVAEAASHEAGHTLDLYHDGNASSGYYGGHSVEGGGGWGPIMGVGYTRDITQWSRGDYPGATNTQDDTAILASHLGWASSGSSVVGPPVLMDGQSLVGVVEQSTVPSDVEIVVPTGDASITITPAATTSNLVASATLLQGSTVIATATPTTAVGWTLTFDERLSAGIYTVRLSSIGWGSVSSGDLDGFTKYGSIGQFLIELDVEADTSVTTTAPPTTAPPTTAPPTTAPPTTAPPTTAPPTTAPPTTVPPTTAPPTTAPPTTAPPTTAPPTTAPPTTAPPTTNFVNDPLITTQPAGCKPPTRRGLMGLGQEQAVEAPCFSAATRITSTD